MHSRLRSERKNRSEPKSRPTPHGTAKAPRKSMGRAPRKSAVRNDLTKDELRASARKAQVAKKPVVPGRPAKRRAGLLNTASRKRRSPASAIATPRNRAAKA